MIKNKEEIRKKIKEYISTKEFKCEEKVFGTIFMYSSDSGRTEQGIIRYYYYVEKFKDIGIDIEDTFQFADEFKFIFLLKMAKELLID